MRNLILIFGDQLSHRLSSLDEFDSRQDRVWMAEVHNEATKVWCHKARLVFFFSAMRHFRDELIDQGFDVDYHCLSNEIANDLGPDFELILKVAIKKHLPRKVIFTETGDWFVEQEIRRTCEEFGVEFEVRVDRHFYCSISDFTNWSKGKKSLVMEHFYRWMRREHGVLIDDTNQPIGGEWNYDKDNRKSFGKAGPSDIRPVKRFRPDEITQEVIELVQTRYADHPGDLESFAYPVTAKQARQALKDFVKHRLPRFGDHQDAMWSDTDFLNHSRLSAVINVHLLDPRDAVNAAVEAFDKGSAPIHCVEGFVRQIIGWREFVRGIYWTLMPEYIERNSLGCTDRDVPESFWNGETEMNCIRESMKTLLRHAYAHHIQRLMVLGLYAQLLGVHPRKFHDWHVAMYADAIDWVSLPNTLGMSQHGDDGVVGTKPYCASGAYIDRMSNYCKSCRFNPKQAVGDEACPITTLYWDFLDRHRDQFRRNRRMVFQIKNLEKKTPEQIQEIRVAADQIKKGTA